MANVFISYSHKDESIKEKLEDHFSALIQRKIVSIWQDRLLLAGSSFDDEIKENINNADIILLLMSSNFMKSKYCSQTELPIALKRHQNGQAVAIGIIVSPCQWKNTPIARYVSLPKDAKPITKHGNRDDAYLYIVDEVEKRARILNRLNGTAKLAYNKVSDKYSILSPILKYISSLVVPFIAQHYKPIGATLAAFILINHLSGDTTPQALLNPQVYDNPHELTYSIRTERANFRSTPSKSNNIIRTISNDEFFWSYEQHGNEWWSAINQYGEHGYLHESVILK